MMAESMSGLTGQMQAPANGAQAALAPPASPADPAGEPRTNRPVGPVQDCDRAGAFRRGQSPSCMSQRSVLITGCSSGIGLDAARTLSARGWRVFAACRKSEDVEARRAEGLDSVLIDHADARSVDEGAQAVLDATDGSLDALFNNGAYGIPGRVEDLPREALDAILQANLLGPHQLTRAVIPAMRRAGRGRLINCSSVLGFAALRYRGAYNSTKFAMEGLTDTLRLELSHTPLHVVLIQPGPIATRIRENSIPHFERWIDVPASAERDVYERELMPRLYEPSQKKDRFELPPSAVTDALIHALESDRPKARYRITTPTRVAAMLKRLLPTRLLDRVLLNS